MRLRTVVPGLALVALAGCGTKDKGPDFTLKTPPPYVGAYAVAPTGQHAVDKQMTKGDAVRLRPVIDAWSRAVRGGDLATASTFFDLPAIVYQPASGALELRTPAITRAFNGALPCGAKLLSTSPAGRYVVGTFQLVAVRGRPCSETATLAHVGFVFGDANHPRQFTEWWQIGDAKGLKAGPSARPKGTTPATVSDFSSSAP